jgi:hypothetical protein
MVHSESMELSDQLSGSHSLTAPVHPPERDTGPPELHHLKGRYQGAAKPRSCVVLNASSHGRCSTLFLAAPRCEPLPLEPFRSARLPPGQSPPPPWGGGCPGDQEPAAPPLWHKQGRWRGLTIYTSIRGGLLCQQQPGQVQAGVWIVINRNRELE